MTQEIAHSTAAIQKLREVGGDRSGDVAVEPVVGREARIEGEAGERVQVVVGVVAPQRVLAAGPGVDEHVELVLMLELARYDITFPARNR
jgi:hypothetical protein